MTARDPMVTFEEASHTYRFMGAVVPSVTQVLQPLVDFSGVPRAVLEAKRDLGSRVHLACEFDDAGDLDEESLTDERPYVMSWRKFLRETGARVLSCEQLVFEPLYQFAGKLDRVVQIDRAKWLIDLKTSFSLPMAVGPQTAAYQRALGDLSVTHRGALQLRADGTYKLSQLTGADDWACFLSCLTLKKFKESHS